MLISVRGSGGGVWGVWGSHLHKVVQKNNRTSSGGVGGAGPIVLLQALEHF